MIPKCKKVLKGVNYLCKDGTSTSTLDIVLYFHHRINDLDLANTLKYLKDQGYIEASIDSENTIEMIFPTYKGNHYQEFIIDDLKSFLFRSLLVPTVVALITALLTVMFTA